jgi:hypothetical protein
MRMIRQSHVVLLALVALSWTVPCVAQDDFHFENATVGTPQIETYLKVKKSPLVGTGHSFIQYGQQFDIDPQLIVAIAGNETGFGNHVRPGNTNNAWNWFWNGPRTSPFDSYDSGVKTLSKYLRRNYLNKGYTTIPLIAKRYCAEGCDSWIPLVTQFRDELGKMAAGVPPTTTPENAPTPTAAPSKPSVKPSTKPSPVVTEPPSMTATTVPIPPASPGTTSQESSPTALLFFIGFLASVLIGLSAWGIYRIVHKGAPSIASAPAPIPHDSPTITRENKP